MEEFVKNLGNAEDEDITMLQKDVRNLHIRLKNLEDTFAKHISEYESYNKYESNAQEEEIKEKLIEHLSKNNVLRKVYDKTHFRISKNIVDCEVVG